MNTPTMSRRGLGLVVALLLALLATAAMVSYVRQASRRAQSGGAAVAVYVAKDVIVAGTTGKDAVSHGLIERTTIPARLVADGAVKRLDEISNAFASVTILRGEQIVRSRFTQVVEAPKLLSIPAGMRALSIEVDAPPGVAGFVQPHDHVGVIAKVDEQGAGGVRVQFVAQGLEVLAVGQRSPAPPSGSREQTRTQSQQQTSDKVLLTLAATPAQAEQLAYAVLQGNVYFTLEPAGAKPASTGGRTAQNEFSR